MVDQEEQLGNMDSSLEGVNSDLSIEMETDPETQVTRVSMSGTLTVEVTPVVDERGNTVYVIGGTQMQYVKRKSAMETALRYHVGQAFDKMWAEETAKQNAASGDKQPRKNNRASISSDLEIMRAQLAALTEMMSKKVSTGHQNGNHDTDIASAKIRAKS